ncbi:MAG: PEP-CTERM sorting domain-containing protein [Proteobacteria bacterium]|nr:PEP-CTERM sorting domain-containing protein [Pseudomonadota bacterium]
MQAEPPASYRKGFIDRIGLTRWLDQPTRMILRRIARFPGKAALTAAGLAASLALLAAAPAQAVTVAITANGQWNQFNIDDSIQPSYTTKFIDTETGNATYGEQMFFSFTIGAGQVGTLTVVDAGFGGDTFTITDNGATLGTTSDVPVTTFATAPGVGYDYNAALANSAFSKGVFILQAGNHSISGSLLQSVLVDVGAGPLNATVGALKLEVSAVPEPATLVSLLAGLGLIGLVVRRRSV